MATTFSSGFTAYPRERLAHLFLSGDGLEIGALHSPLPLPPGVHATYVDRMSVADLRTQYPELDGYALVQPDIIDDGETLASVASDSQDFVIANHMLEHCENPIGALVTFHRVLKPHGIVFLSVPDKRYTFDRDRAATTLEHLERDYRMGPHLSREEHYREWARDVNKLTDEADIERRAMELLAMKYSIHFHVWTDRELRELLWHVQALTGFSLMAFRTGEECLIVLQKQ